MNRDPDLIQAIEDLRPVFAELRGVKRDMRKLDRTIDHQKHVAASAHAADLRGQISTRAEKLALDADALVAVLAAEHYERLRIRRKPNYEQMAKVLRAERSSAASSLSEAEREVEAAKERLAKCQRNDRAARAAVLMYTGFER